MHASFHPRRPRELLLRWENGSRYYLIHLHTDLWGALCVTRAWGARGTSQGQVRHQLCETRAEAARLLWQLRGQRRARGYQRRFRAGLAPG